MDESITVAGIADGWTDETLASVLLTIIREELGSGRIGPDDDFYEMGGDSLIAVRVISRANGLGIPVRLIDLLSYPSVTELVPNLPMEPDEVPTSGGEGIGEPGRRGAVRAASALQIGLIYQCEMSDDPGLYNDLIGMRVQVPFDETVFRAALAELVERHSALRSSFDLAGYEEAVQLISAEVELPLEVDRITSGDGADAVAAWRTRQLAEAFDWSRAPLFRCHVAAVADSFQLTVAIHHAVMDGWSFATILVDLLTFYDAGLRGIEAGLPPVPSHGMAIFEAAELEAVGSAEAAAFWRSQADAAPLLADRARFAAPADASSRRELLFSAELFADLRKAAAVAKVPVKSLLLAVHCWALARWSGRSGDIVTGVVVNGRPEIEGSDLLVGLFLNTVPIRLASAEGSWTDLAAAMHATELEGLAHRRYPLARIEEDLGRRSFDVAFNFTDFHVYRRVEQLGIKVDGWWAVDKASHPVSCDYTVDFPGFGTGLVVTFDESLVSGDRVEEFIAIVRGGLRAAAADVTREVAGG
ncbi:condensation domain-containing protein [Amycolatopsis sp. NPDC058340]|uniref:condensation domain-containing protein n=1 Tax=Amycolatopsis sp. NPDC058340 TaxID=3346453 RepID=UPI0036591ED9